MKTQEWWPKQVSAELSPWISGCIEKRISDQQGKYFQHFLQLEVSLLSHKIPLPASIPGNIPTAHF